MTPGAGEGRGSGGLLMALQQRTVIRPRFKAGLSGQLPVHLSSNS